MSAWREEKRVLIIAGETSGDLHGARLVERMRARRPDLVVYGIGGEEMERAGVRLAFHCSELAVVGIVEIVGRLRTIGRAFRWIRRTLLEEPPDLVVLIDFPDFNLRVARRAAACGIPVAYYISPQIWAWRGGRIRRIAACVNRMIVIFPFEEALYRRHGVPVTYVGHPLLDRLGETVQGRGTDRGAYEEAGLSPLYPVVGLFPGSRPGEVRTLLPVMLGAARRLRGLFPRLQFLLGKAPGLDDGLYASILARKEDLPVRSLRGEHGFAMALCDLAMVASGTATLELALLGVPMVVVYRVSRPTFWLGRLLVRVPSIAMVNLVSQRMVVPELIQGELDEESLADLCRAFLTDAVYRAQVVRALAEVRAMLGRPGASDRAAEVICGMLDRAGGLEA